MNKTLLALGLITLFSAASAMVYLSRVQYTFWDEAVYLSMADAFSGNPYFFEFFRPPLWTFLLSMIPRTVLAANILSFTVFVAGIPMIFWLSRRSLDETKSIMVAFFYAFNHLSLFYAGVGTTESLAILLLFISFLSFYGAVRKGGIAYWITSGAALGLAVMTKHTAAFLIFPIVAYLLIDRKAFRAKRFLGFVMAAGIALSPWLVSMQILFGNPIYPQLENIGTSTFESPLFYVYSMPFFLGIQGLLILPGLLLLRKSRFVLLGGLTLAMGTILLSMVGHKELRYMMVMLPATACLEAMGFGYLMERYRRLSTRAPTILVASGIAVAAFLTITVPVMPYDQGLDDCIFLAGQYYTDKTLSSPAVFFAFSYKEEAMQLPLDPGTATCGLIDEIGADHVIIYENWEFEQVREDLLSGLEPCTRILRDEGDCLILGTVPG